jgi:hypothetical protein
MKTTLGAGAGRESAKRVHDGAWGKTDQRKIAGKAAQGSGKPGFVKNPLSRAPWHPICNKKEITMLSKKSLNT